MLQIFLSNRNTLHTKKEHKSLIIFQVESYCCNDKENCNEEKFDDDLKAMTQNFNA